MGVEPGGYSFSHTININLAEFTHRAFHKKKHLLRFESSGIINHCEVHRALQSNTFKHLQDSLS